MTLFEMYELIELVLNKDYGGNIVTPARFRQLIKVVNINKFKEKYGLPEEYQPGRPVPLEYAEITLKNQDDLRYFKIPLMNTPCPVGLLPYPADYAHRDQIIYNHSVTIDGVVTIVPRQVEVLRETEAAGRRGNYTKRPTVTNPIAVVRSTGIQIYPVTITAVDFTYYRWPVEPVFEYNQYEGYITYNSASSTEFEWPEDVHIDLVRMMLEYLGVNLREADIVQYANTKMQQGI
ncbi:MAG: hypothetical protein BWY95_00069 [Bacteroidetes bacterium ADurb.BinA104]|nr:MAG: hypothetical protein BWY95_00069 [Bacteroidetes bacterium ADurb.BinA104]